MYLLLARIGDFGRSAFALGDRRRRRQQRALCNLKISINQSIHNELR